MFPEWLNAILLRIKALFRRRQLEQDLDDETQFHLAMSEQKLVEQGMAADEAHYAALRRFGNVAAVREECREAWGIRFLNELVQDVRFGLRQLRQSPAFTATAILALALGIGATTAIFSVINTVLLQPLPYPHPERLVQLGIRFPPGEGFVLSISEFMGMRQATGALEDFTLYDFGGPRINLTGGDRPEQLQGTRASVNYFRLFGAQAILGRTFSAKEDRPGGAHVAVISYGLWQNRFGGNRDIIGKNIDLGGVPFVVTGVLNRGFIPDPSINVWHPHPPADIWLPLQANPESSDKAHYLAAAARLKPGVTLAEANAQLQLATVSYKRKFPGAMPPKATFAAAPMRDVVIGTIRPTLLILLGAVFFVLLIACANVANLLVVRATLRKREMAIRAAVGAGRGRIVRQLLTESVMLSVAGGVAGLFLGFVGVRALLATNPGFIPRVGQNGSAVTLDGRVLLFTFVVALLTGVLFGLVPAFHASRSELHATLKESGAWAGTGFHYNKSRSVLVITEIALALVLLAGAGLMIRTLVGLRRVDPGIDPRNILTMQMALSGPRFEKSAAVATIVRQAEQEVGSIPGVVAVSASSSLPLEGRFGMGFRIIGRPLSGRSRLTGGAEWVSVSPEFFSVFRIPLLHGRVFSDLDSTSAPQVVIINEAMVRHFWPKGKSLGQQIIIGPPEFKEPARTIVGIVGNVHDTGLGKAPPPIMYVPQAQLTDSMTALDFHITPMVWAVRTQVAPFSLRAAIQEKLRDASGGLPVAHFRTMDQHLMERTSRADFDMVLLVVFASVALLLAAIGIYGLISYSVQQRTHEIGIRMALGARSNDMRKMVFRQGMLLALGGLVIGVGAALALTRLMASILYGVKPWDPLAIISGAVLLSLIALVATYIPARRAAKVDPMVALRYE